MNAEFNTQKEFYDNGYQASRLGIFGFPDLKIVDYNLATKNKKILNVGGGNGADVWFLAKENEVYLIDGSQVAVKQAQTHNIKAQVADVSNYLAFEDGDFDIVILKDILEHIYNPFFLLQEARRVLKDDGYLIISLPNHFYLPFRLRILFGGNFIWKSLLHNHKKDFEEWDYMHIRFFTWKGVKKMLTHADLKIEKGYWDFGTLAHYSDPLMYENAFKMNNKKISTKRQYIMYKVLIPCYKIFNFIFPKKIRSFIVSTCPSLWCAGFYIKVKKK